MITTFETEAKQYCQQKNDISNDDQISFMQSSLYSGYTTNDMSCNFGLPQPFNNHDNTMYLKSTIDQTDFQNQPSQQKNSQSNDWNENGNSQMLQHNQNNDNESVIDFLKDLSSEMVEEFLAPYDNQI